MSSVVLPARLGPRSAKTSPGSIPKLTPRKACDRSAGTQAVPGTSWKHRRTRRRERRHGYLIRAICTPFSRIFVKVLIMFVDICAVRARDDLIRRQRGGSTGLGARVVLHGLQGCAVPHWRSIPGNGAEADGVEPEGVPRRAVSGRKLLDQGIDLVQDRGVVDVGAD